jgi:hypothetical protein
MFYENDDRLLCSVDLASIDWMISACCSSTNNIVVVICQSAVMQEQFKIYSPLARTFVFLWKSNTCHNHFFLLVHWSEFLIGHYLHLNVKVFPPSSFLYMKQQRRRPIIFFYRSNVFFSQEANHHHHYYRTNS